MNQRYVYDNLSVADNKKKDDLERVTDRFELGLSNLFLEISILKTIWVTVGIALLVVGEWSVDETWVVKIPEIAKTRRFRQF